MLLLRVCHVCVFIVVSLRSSTNLLYIIVVSIILAFVCVAVPCVAYIALWIWILDTCIYVVVGFTYCFRRHTLAVDYSLWINYSCRDGEQVQRVLLQ